MPKSSERIASVPSAPQPSLLRPTLNRLEAAEYLRISVRTLDRETSKGRIRAARIGSRVIYSRAELDRLIEVQMAVAA